MREASILLVEDEALIRMMLFEMIEGLGHRVIAEAGSVVEARSLAEIEEYDLAILDINLKGVNVRPVAEAIAARGLPVLFLSGYGPAGVPDGFKEMPVLHAGSAQEHDRCRSIERSSRKSSRQERRSIVDLRRLRAVCHPGCYAERPAWAAR